ncbi:PREDICTED: uncharacterized protein LOC109230026 [Nicotiana attenuata]|uniref:uncharacterized protein LOC109230026 n=1 Tax=Nicotiana attenuata TaxID=49451 RepID=UPI0009051702|nr:PREDICTED: uncharacterized protein LOC109230026 [Nicotiana attenuata]
MRADIKNVFNTNVSYGKCKRAKREILEKLEGSFTDGYNKIEAYANELGESNPGSDVIINLSNDALAQAWAIVDKETKRTLNWFLELLQRSLDLKEGEEITFMSDMQKSQIKIFVKHIEANWCKKWRTDEFKKLLWWCSWCSYEEDFKDQLKSIGKLDKEAAEALLKYPPQAWCRAYFDTVYKNQRVDNNFTKSLREREESASLWATSFSPHSMKLYNEYLKIANRRVVNSNGEFGYKVKEEGDTHTVNVAVKRCTCRGWDLIGIPCPHAIKAIQYKKMDPLKEINWWYSKEAYMLTYKHKLQPVRGEKFWKVEESQAMKPPELVKLAGRPKIKRSRQKDEAIKQQGEWGVSRKGRLPNKEKRQRMLDEDEEVGQHPQEEINLTAPQCSQASQGPEFVFMHTPGVYSETSSSSFPAFEHPELEMNQL